MKLPQIKLPRPHIRLTRRHVLAVCIPLGILLLLLLAAFFFGNGGNSAFRDDVDAILARPREDEIGELTFDDDGSAVLRLYKDDIYLLADENGFLDDIRDQLQERFGSFDIGMRLSGGKLRVCISYRVFWLVRVSVQAQVSVSWDGSALVLHAESALLGSHTSLPYSLWPKGLREDMRVDLSGTGRAEEISDIYLDGNTAVVHTVPLSLPDMQGMHKDETLAEEIRFFGADDEVLSALELFDRLTAGDVLGEDELPAGSRSELIAWLFTLADEDDAAADELFSSFFKSHSESQRRELESELGDRESLYTKLLTSVREQYKGGALRIQEDGFYLIATNELFDPFSDSSLSATAEDARVVLLTSGSGSDEVTSADVPVLKSVETRGKRALQDLDPEHAYDIGIALTTDGGVPALLYRRADGNIVVRELSEETYVQILVSGGRPDFNVDTLPEAAAEIDCGSCLLLPLEN